MATKVLILLGTKKGAFVLESDALRHSWRLRGPFCETWPMNHVIADPATAKLTPETALLAWRALRAAGETVGDIDWLAPGIACDIALDAPPEPGLRAIATNRS